MKTMKMKVGGIFAAVLICAMLALSLTTCDGLFGGGKSGTSGSSSGGKGGGGSKGGETVAVSGVSLDHESLTITFYTSARGTANIATLIPTVRPSNATNKAVDWTSSNSAVATVADGVVTANATGTTTIYVTTADGGKEAQCIVTVTVKESLIEMVAIPAGTFMMGSPENEPNRYSNETQHEVTLTSSFYMGKYEVTRRQYETVMSGATNWTDQALFNVSWYEAVEFCNKLSEFEGLTPYYAIDKNTIDPDNLSTDDTLKWLVTVNTSANGYRLPTEAEWEYACRAGTTTAWYFGDSNTNIDSYAWSYHYGNDSVHAVGEKLPNAWELYDMHGNVSEWCWDWHEMNYYSNSPTDNPTGASSGVRRENRGGSINSLAMDQRSALRNYLSPFSKDKYTGFRLVRSLGE